MGNNWKIGQRGRNNGVLLIVAPNDRKVRIEVGLGLEQYLTNAEAQSIIDNDILPYFRNGQMEQGIVNGSQQIVAALNGTYSPPPAQKESFLDTILKFLLIPIYFILRLFGIGKGEGGFSGGGGSFGGGGASGSW